MKIEVGKKYVDKDGFVVNIFAVHPNTKEFMGVDDGDGIYPYRYDIHGNIQVGGSCRTSLVKEYTEPKTQDVWLIWVDMDGTQVIRHVRSCDELREQKVRINSTREKLMAIKKVTLTEGELDNDRQ